MLQMRMMMIFFLFLFFLGVTCDSQKFRCDEQDQSSLLRLKHDLVFDSTVSYMLDMWSSSSDCCDWQEVTCGSDDGHVIAIRLEGKSILGGINDSNSPLFDLHHLRFLDLSSNDFNGTEIPSGIGKLVNLVYLKLSYSNFVTKLSCLISNLTMLTHLGLDDVDMSAEGEGHAWGQALSSSVPHLQVLSLNNCSLSGPLHASLVKLQSLTSIDLSHNNLSSQVPDFLAEFPNLTSLRLYDCRLYGKLPPSIFSMIALRVLILRSNDMLSGTLPENIGNTTTLTDLILDGCGFSGSITDIRWENLEKLVLLDLSGNALSGTIPPSMFSLPSLRFLHLPQNQFNGFSVGEFPLVSPSPLSILDLSGNKFEGPIPTPIFRLPELTQIDLSHNNFSGTFDLSNLYQNFNLSYVVLSFNSLSVIETVDSTIYSSFPHQLSSISLASCNLKAFPSLLKNYSMLYSIDLSVNKIGGEIPSWIWKRSLGRLILSHNSLTGFEGLSHNLTFLSPPSYLDLSSNLLQGQIPFALFGAGYDGYLEFLSLSNNSFHGGIPQSLCKYFSGSTRPVIDLSTNFFSGTIPPCLSFGVLNLKSNNLSGNIPNAFPDDCSLHTLDLSDNHLQGTVPKSMINCKALEVINLGNNDLNDEFPFWLMNISSLRVLVLRSNQFRGVVRYETSKQARGWSKLQIIDIAANKFCGELPLEIFKFWTGMMGQIGTPQPKSEKLKFGYYQDRVVVNYKGFSVELVKILTIFTTIDFSCNHFEGSIPRSIGDLTFLHTLNLSHNHFTGEIPSSFGSLKWIESLDLANNRISGVIPGQLASLTFISYLNLSYNQLVGRIPTGTQLQSLPKSSYIGNKGLYGPPLDESSCGRACGSGVLPLDPNSTEVGKGINWKFICVEIGYVIGLGAVIGSLVFWRRWRFWFFEHVDRLLFKVFPRLDPKKRNHRKRA